MLSSKDYHLALEWMNRGYKLESVLKGIKKAFENNNNIRRLSDCIEYIETTENDEINVNNEYSPSDKQHTEYLTKIITNLSTLIESEKDQKINTFYKSYIDKIKYLLNSDLKNIYNEVNTIEEEFFNEFPEQLDKEKSKEFQAQLNKFIRSGKDYINEKAKNKALNNHAKNFIIDNYLVINPFELL